MIERRVTHTRKAEDGDITHLCHPGKGWSPRTKRDAIHDIETNTRQYYVQWHGHRTKVSVVPDTIHGKYLRTDRDETPRNNLLDLPDC